MRALCTFRPNPIKGWGCNARIFFVVLLLQMLLLQFCCVFSAFLGGSPLVRARPAVAVRPLVKCDAPHRALFLYAGLDGGAGVF